MVFSNNLLAGSGGQSTGYEIDQSIRFNKSASAQMTRTFGTPTDRNKFTYAFWMKACSESNGYCLETNVTGGVTFSGLVFNGGSMQVFDFTSGTGNIDVRTTFTSGIGKFRDYTAWYHAMFVYDSDQGTAADRLKFFVNGRQFPSASLVGASGGSPTFPSSGFNSSFNASGVVHRISSNVNGKVDGYMADIYFIDGQALTPSSFGEFSSTTGEFLPIEYSGAFGNNGFFIDGRDSSDLGDDESGNGNDFSTSNMGTDDQVTDSPTNNFSIFNSLGSCNVSGQALTISDGNLRTSASGTTNAIEAVGTIAATTGKYYAEFTLNAAPQLSNQYPAIGIIGIDLNITGGNNLGNSSFFGFLPNGNKLSGGSSASYGDTYGNGDIIGIALDLDNQKIYFSKNGTYQASGDPAAGSNAAFTNLVAGTEYRFCVSHAGSSATDVSMNAGQLPFNTAAPTGFSPMSTANLPAPTIADPSEYFQSVQYATTTSAQDITFGGNSDLAPDWLWFKRRDHASDHFLFDKVRGVLKTISSNDTNPEVTSAGSLTAFGTDGFSLGDGGSDNDINGASSSGNFMAWGWAAGGTSGSSNSDGSVTSTVSANTTAGFSICKLNPGGNNNITFGHGLGVAPRLVIVKNLEDATNWQVLHLDQGVGNKIFLNSSNAAASDANMWQNTAPTSTVVSMGTAQTTNEDVIAYCFAEVEGYSKFGSYIGNGSTDGPFIYLGFKPSWVMFKRTNASADWMIKESSGRDPFNVMTNRILANTSYIDDPHSTNNLIDFVSNGMKHRAGSGTGNYAMNTSGSTYLYIAFAESPFKTANAK